MSEEDNEADDIGEQEQEQEQDEEDGDDLCDEKTVLETDEITNDEDLPAATGGVEE